MNIRLQKYYCQPGIQASREGESVSIHDSSGRPLCTVNAFGAAVLNLCDGRRTLEAIEAELQTHYPEVDRGELRLSTREFIENLLKNNVILEKGFEEQPRALAYDRHETANIVLRKNSECAQLFIFFKGVGNALMMAPMRFLVETGVANRNIMLVRDPHRKFYQLGVQAEFGDFSSFVQSLKEQAGAIPALREIYTVGTSMGAYAAIAAGHALQATMVYSLGLGTSHLQHLLDRGKDGEQQAAIAANGDSMDLRRLLRSDNGRTEYRLYYNESHRNDRESAETLRDLPGVRLHALPGKGHQVVSVLKESGELGTLFPPFRAVYADA